MDERLDAKNTRHRRYLYLSLLRRPSFLVIIFCFLLFLSCIWYFFA